MMVLSFNPENDYRAEQLQDGTNYFAQTIHTGDDNWASQQQFNNGQNNVIFQGDNSNVADAVQN
ncbi:MAG: hypothetical protein ACR2MX_01990 [Cyclobacteriaceae bacterium]